MNEDLRLGFASNDFAGTKWKNLTGTAWWSDGTEMVTLDYSHLTSMLWGVRKGFAGPAGRGGSLAGPAGAEERVVSSCVSRPPRSRGTLLKPQKQQSCLFKGAQGPGRRLQREGPAEAVPTREAARPRRDAGHGLRGAEGRRGPAGAGAPAARAGQVGRRGAERPAAGRPHRLQPEHPAEDEGPGGDGRLHPGGRRGSSAEQERRDGRPGHQARRAGADAGRRELRGHDRPGQRVRHAGPGAARSRAPHEAARGPQRHGRGGLGHPDAEEGPGHKGGAQGRAVERPLRAGGRGLQRPAARDGVRRPQGRGEAAGHRVPAAAGQRRQVPFRAPTNAARSFNPQYGDVQQLRAVDSMTVRSTEGRETLLKLALPAPQGSGNAAGRLTRRGRPAAVRQLDDFEAQDPRLIKPCFGGKNGFEASCRPPCCQRTLHKPFLVQKNCLIRLRWN